MLPRDDALAVLLSGSLLDADTEILEVNGVVYEKCTYRPELPPQISLSVAGARVTREAFDDHTRRFLPNAQQMEGLGDAATYDKATRSLRVLTGSTLFLIQVQRHPDGKEVATAAAERVLARMAAQQR